MSEETKCSSLGDIVSPCRTLSKHIDSENGHRKGITIWNYCNMKTGERTRTAIGVKTLAAKNGIAFNFCPFCGEKYPYAE